LCNRSCDAGRFHAAALYSLARWTYLEGLPEPVGSKPATPEDLAEALVFAPRYSGRKKIRASDESVELR
jgi:hypothetical protein